MVEQRHTHGQKQGTGTVRSVWGEGWKRDVRIAVGLPRLRRVPEAKGGPGRGVTEGPPRDTRQTQRDRVPTVPGEAVGTVTQLSLRMTVARTTVRGLGPPRPRRPVTTRVAVGAPTLGRRWDVWGKEPGVPECRSDRVRTGT